MTTFAHVVFNVQSYSIINIVSPSITLKKMSRALRVRYTYFFIQERAAFSVQLTETLAVTPKLNTPFSYDSFRRTVAGFPGYLSWILAQQNGGLCKKKCTFVRKKWKCIIVIMHLFPYNIYEYCYKLLDLISSLTLF